MISSFTTHLVYDKSVVPRCTPHPLQDPLERRLWQHIHNENAQSDISLQSGDMGWSLCTVRRPMLNTNIAQLSTLPYILNNVWAQYIEQHHLNLLTGPTLACISPHVLIFSSGQISWTGCIPFKDQTNKHNCKNWYQIIYPTQEVICAKYNWAERTNMES